ncbi:MAG: SRPBCC family protein [Chloroflexota bacterium]
MPDFERSQQIPIDADTAFEYVSNPRHLPEFVAMMSDARPGGTGALHVTAEVNGRHEEGEARFRADPSSRSLEWGGGNGSDYHGSMRFEPIDRRTSSAHLTLHTRDDNERRDIERALDQTMDNLRDLFID